MRNLFFTATLLFCCTVNLVNAEELITVTENLPPLQFTNQDKHVDGATTEIVRTLLTKAEIESDIFIFPWARTYEIAKKRKNTLVYSLVRSKEREDDFIWIGELYKIKAYLTKLKSRDDLQVKTLVEAKQYKTGIIRLDIAENFFRNHGFTETKNMILASNYNVLWRWLYSGRVDFAVTNNLIWKEKILEINENPEQLELYYELEDFSSNMYLAASKTTDPEIVTKLIRAYQLMVKEGEISQILQKWQLK